MIRQRGFGSVCTGLLLSLLGSGSALAQPAESGEDAPSGRERREDRRERVEERFGEGSGAERRARIRERVRLLRAWRLTEVIDMDEAAAARLFELLDALDVRVGAEEDALAEAGRELRGLLESGEGEDARVGELVEHILASHLRIEEARTQMVRDAGAFLTPRQQAALMLFLPDFDNEIREMVRDVRRERRGRHERRVEETEEEIGPHPDPDPRPVTP